LCCASHGSNDLVALRHPPAQRPVGVLLDFVVGVAEQSGDMVDWHASLSIACPWCPIKPQ
jgi:hypothetical protein